MDVINELEANKNHNGGGLAVNITGRYESNRHAIAKIEKLTAGDCVKFLKTKKGGELVIDSKHLVKSFIAFKGYEPEWHHAGFLPKKYGGGMKKTYFFDSCPTKKEVIKWMKKLSSKTVKNLRSNHEYKFKQLIIAEFENTNGKNFSRINTMPEFSFIKTREMSGKYGWFFADDKYSLPIYFSGVTFENQDILNQYLQLL